MIKQTSNARGFTLVELLIVVAMLGLVLGAVFTIYTSQMKRAFSQEEVLDIQQNLRFSLDAISRDLTMAGVLLPAGITPLAAASGANQIIINTPSADGRMARVTVAALTGATVLKVEPAVRPTDPNPLDGFTAGDNLRIIRPDIRTSTAGPLVVQLVNRVANTITVSTPIADDVAVGDMLVKTANNSPLPHTIDYRLVPGGTTIPAAPAAGAYNCPGNQNQQCLVRRVSGTNPPLLISEDIIATNLSSLTFAYVSDADTTTAPPAPGLPVPSDLTRAVRVTVQGATSKTANISVTGRTRSITSVIKLRNRRRDDVD